jgi:hypothetical protein
MQSPENKGAESKVDANDVVKNGTIKVEIPDECGDNLWDEVLAQSANHTEVLDNRQTLCLDKRLLLKRIH